jgi:hypothetical protein
MKRNNISNIKPDKDGNYHMKVNNKEELLYNPKGVKPTKLEPSKLSLKKEREIVIQLPWPMAVLIIFIIILGLIYLIVN